MSFWESIRIGASGLLAQRTRLDVISNNIANSQTTRTADGGAYQRQDVVFEENDGNGFTPAFVKALNGTSSGTDSGVRVSQVVTDTTEGQQVYDPTHADADENGYVTYPNVDPVVEMTNMMSATRSYEANLSMIEAAKNMAQRALDIGQ